MESKKSDDAKVDFTPTHGSSKKQKTDYEEEIIVDIPKTQLVPFNPLSNRKLGIERVPASEVHPMDRCRVADAPLLFPCDDKDKGRIKMSPPGIPHVDKLESTSENDLQSSNTRNMCRAGNEITLKTESAPATRADLMLDFDVVPMDYVISNSHFPPSNSRGCKNESKGKGKALSEGDVSRRVSNDEEEDDSYESVESCNSARIFSSGKRRLNFEQELIIGHESKRTKQIEQIPLISGLLTKHDSSFMNWMWNMMKGFARPLNQQGDARPLGLALAKPSHTHEDLDAATDNDFRPLDSRSMGFSSIFQSMYCPNRSAKGMATDFIQLGERSANVELPRQVGTTDANMMICLGKESDAKVSKDKLNEVSFGNFITSQDIVRACSSGNSSSSGFEDGKGETAHSSPLQEKKDNDHGYTGDPLGSMWITRFSARSPCSLIKQEIGNPSTKEACKSAQNSVNFSLDQAALEARECADQEPSHVIVDRELKSFGFSTEPSVVFGQIENSIFRHKMNKILASPRLKNSEAMASVFARRLDALKNIMSSSDLKDDSSKVTTSCIFCGQKGHQLQNCSEITETELEDLLRSIKSYDNAEGSPCLCIRCFQLNHWAVACPNMSQNKNLTDNLQCNIRLKEAVTLDGIESSSNQVQMKLNVNMTSSGNFQMWQVSDMPKGVFGAVNALRLSRTDILRWMNSQMSLSHLDGYFLRLRLGKWEEGLGGTGYYVACITGMQDKCLVRNTRCPISVNVGGITCLVENKYISNHDFLEDELMAWWCTASRCGVKIPSEEELKMKADEKKLLGF